MTTPPGYAERECILVSYGLPLFKHCFALCHDPKNSPAPTIDLQIMAFFMSQAHELSQQNMGNPHSFVVICNGGFVRKRANLHMHVFLIRNRAQKCWLYTMLAVVHGASALRRLVLRMMLIRPKPTS